MRISDWSSDGCSSDLYLHEPVGPVKREDWFGWRPISVDDMPIIGRAPGHRHAWLATGHGMLGVSMRVATAQLVADLVCALTPRLDPPPSSPPQFARAWRAGRHSTVPHPTRVLGGN